MTQTTLNFCENMIMFMTSDVFDLTLKLSADTTLLTMFFCSCFYLAHEEKNPYLFLYLCSVRHSMQKKIVDTGASPRKWARNLKSLVSGPLKRLSVAESSGGFIWETQRGRR